MHKALAQSATDTALAPKSIALEQQAGHAAETRMIPSGSLVRRANASPKMETL